MTDEKICPIMSRPYLLQGNTRMHYAYCQKEQCMSWETTSASCSAEGKKYEGCEECEDDAQPDCKHYVVEAGFCKLIEGSNHA
jgi:hypothetical protein